MAVNTKRLDQLIETGESVVGTTFSIEGIISGPYVNSEQFEQWRMSSLAFLDAAYSRDNHYYRSFVERCEHAKSDDAKAGLAILRAVKDDIGAEIEPTVKSVVFSDLPLHPRIKEVSLDLYADGYYAEAVLEASKSLINYVKERRFRRGALDD